MLHDDFITYRIAEISSKLNDIKNIKQQYIAQLIMLKETIAECKDALHQKYNLGDTTIKQFFDAKDDILRK